MKKSNLLLSVILAGAFGAWDRLTKPRGSVALANELGLMDEQGRETLQIDPTATLPGASRYLGYMRGSTMYFAKPWDGGSGASSFPLGVSPDSPYQIGDFVTVDRLGGVKGIRMGFSAGAITVDHLVCAAAGGQIADAHTTNATVWIIGRATKTVAAANQEITFLPCPPYLITSNGAGVFTAATQL